MRLTCLHMQRLMERRDSGLSAADGLRLEEHLGGCEACRARANLFDGLKHLAAAQPVSLDAATRARAIAAALTAEIPRTRLSLQPPRPGFVLLGAATALVAVLLSVQRALAPTPVQAPVANQAKAFDRVLSGQISHAGTNHTVGDRLGETAELHTTEGASLALAHAQVELRKATSARWDARTRTLDLQQGSALLEVDPAQHQSFHVQTATFVVAVLGTRFEVTPNAVHVLRGRVSVTPRSSQTSADPVVLTAGTAQSSFELQPTAASEPDSDAVPPAAAQAPSRGHGQAERNAESATRRASTWLEKARNQLAARDVARARSTLALAAPLLHDAALRAQALSLEAECSLQERHFDAARDTYLQVTRRFPQLAAAETALFAAARIEAEHGTASRARQLLARYLERYPSGSFAREAERRLGLLPEAASAEPKP